ncbi:hypothetical protein Emed_003370 [Eimeria media]
MAVRSDRRDPRLLTDETLGRLVGRGGLLLRGHGGAALPSSSPLPVLRQPLAHAADCRLSEGGPLSWVLQTRGGAPRGLHTDAGSGVSEEERGGAPSCSSFHEALPTSALAQLAEGPPSSSVSQPTETGGPPGVSGELFSSPLCLQIDQLICSCEQPDEILRLLVSHRAALYVHNLVTALKALAELTVKGGPPGGPPPTAAQQQQQQQQKDGLESQQAEQQQQQQQQEGEYEVDRGGPLSPSFALLGAQMRGPQPPTWPKDGSSFVSFFSLLSGPEAQAERRHSQRSPAEDLVRDDRYHLLLQDLRQHRRLLTFQAAADVALSLRALRHPHYPLLSALLPALTRGPLPSLSEGALEGGPLQKEGAPEVLSEVLRIRRQQQLLLSVADVYRWAGYTRLPFFDRVARLLRGPSVEGPPLPPPSQDYQEKEQEEEGAPLLHGKGAPSILPSVSAAEVMRCSPSLVAHSLRVLSRVSLSDWRAFGALCLQGALGAPLASAGELTTMAVAAAAKAPYTPETEKLLTCVVSEACMRSGAFSLPQLAQCLSACTASLLHFPSFILLICQRAIPHLTLATRTRQRALLTPDALCSLLKDVFYFAPPISDARGPPGGPPGGPQEGSVGGAPLSDEGLEGVEGGPLNSFKEALLDVSVKYLEDAIDAISPQAAADAVFALAAAERAPRKQQQQQHQQQQQQQQQQLGQHNVLRLPVSLSEVYSA